MWSEPNWISSKPLRRVFSRCKAAALLAVAIPSWIAACSQVNVTTQHYDNARTGQNSSETILTPANVNVNQFGKLFTTVVDGFVYAQPLYMADISINGGSHNVVYVATAHDSVFAIDASTGAILKQVSFIDPAAGITTVSSTDVKCPAIPPEVGITGTPVIDPNSQTLYVVARTKENGAFVQRLHALDLSTLSEKFGGPVQIQASVPGKGVGNVAGQVSFDPLLENSRTGLLLQNGLVYVGFASLCDYGKYHGWLMAYNAGTLALSGVLNTTPNGEQGGIWQSGAGLAGDGTNVFLATGNGTFDGLSDFGESILRVGPPLNGALPVADDFTAFNQSTLNKGDVDVGSGGLVLLPDLPAGSPHQQLLVQAGKEGRIYLLDRNDLGQYCSVCSTVDTQTVQELPGALVGLWGMPTYWNGSVYFAAASDTGLNDSLKAFSFNANGSGLLSTVPTSLSANIFRFPGSVSSVSSSGTSNGIIWTLDNSNYGPACCQALYAYDATNLANQLYNSNQNSLRDSPGGAVKFSIPTVANGMVYVGSKGSLSGYGLLPSNVPTLTLSSSENPSFPTQSVTVTATLTSPKGAPPDGASITFRSGPKAATILGTAPLKGGTAVFTTSPLKLGSVVISAVYPGNPNFAWGIGSMTQQVEQAPTQTSVGSSPNPSQTNQAVTFTATVSSAIGPPKDGDVVNFKQGATLLGSGTLSGGTASFKTSFATSGAPTITAVFPGDSSLRYSTDTLTQTINAPNPTTMTLVSNANPAILGQTVTLTATVTPTTGSAPAEPLTFTQGPTTLATVTLKAGQASYSTSSLPLGYTTIKASFAGDSVIGASTATISQRVLKIPTSVTLTSNVNPASAGQAVSFTATVISSQGTAPPDGENVTFKQGTTILGTAPLAKGQAVFSTGSLPTGTLSIVAAYGGDATLASSAKTIYQKVH